MGFYELLMFDIGLADKTQRAIQRNFYSVRLNQRAKIKKWPVASYSVRRLNTTYYTGPTMKVARTDGALADVYCSEWGTVQAIYSLSTTTNYTTLTDMLNWIGTQDIYLSIWYDQAGSSRHLVSASGNQYKPVVQLFSSD